MFPEEWCYLVWKTNCPQLNCLELQPCISSRFCGLALGAALSWEGLLLLTHVCGPQSGRLRRLGLCLLCALSSSRRLAWAVCLFCCVLFFNVERAATESNLPSASPFPVSDGSLDQALRECKKKITQT